MKAWQQTGLVLAALVACAAAGALVIVRTGAYDVAATEQHFGVVYDVLDVAMRASVRWRSRGLAVPPLDEPESIARGLALYRDHCTDCHGAPGVSPAAFALGLNPPPANLVHTARNWSPRELYWVVRHGIRMTGMPAWRHRLSEGETWAIVAFLERLPELTPQAYAALQAPPVQAPERDPPAPGAPDAVRGERALHQYACITCHEIPGVVGAKVPVGPPLAHMASRSLIAGLLPNTPENMLRWLRDPQGVNPRTAMPDLGLSEADARDIAAFLYTLD